MGTPSRAHRAATVVLSLLIAVIGAGLIVQSFNGHGSTLSARLLLGVLFVAAGVGRLYLEARRGQRA